MAAPLVTGISPKEGVPGTKVTIRGERLGKSQSDLISLEICGVNCLLTAEWISPNKICARTLLCRGRGDIIIVTKSGGVGTCTVQFRGFQETVSATKESAVWVDEGVVVGPRPMSKASLQQDDPLQISLEANEKKFPVEELAEMFPGQSGSFCSDNFSPQWFLLECHHNTGFEDLKAGLRFLGRKISSQSEGKISFLKENMHLVMDQLDSLSELLKICDNYSKGRQKNSSPGLIPEIDEQIGVCEKEAAKMFLEVLNRKDRADVTRNALSGYQRFRFLLGLPGNMQRSIDNGDYDIAISDFVRSKALFTQSEAQKNVFKKFELEVNRIAGNLRNLLKEKLLQKPPVLDDQRTLITHLLNLEVDYDPAWLCLMSHYEFLTTSMVNCFQTLSSSSDSSVRAGGNEQDHGALYNNKETSCVESVSDIFCAYFVPFWQLSQEYFGGKLRIKPELSRQSEVKEMMVGSVTLFCDIASTCIRPESSTTSNLHWRNPSVPEVRWISSCVTFVRKTFNKILSLDPPADIVEKFRNILFDARSFVLDVMSAQMTAEIADLAKVEDWNIEFQQNHGFITALPSKFEAAVVSSAKLMREMLLQKFNEEKSLMKSQQVLKKMTENFGIACAAFADAIEALLTDQKNPAANTSRGLTSNASIRLLLILNNCNFVRTVTFANICRALISLGFPNITASISEATNSVVGVERLVFAHYTEMKYEPVVGLIEQAMFVGSFDWEKFNEPTGVRPYVSKVLIGLVQIVAEVTTVSEKLKTKVLCEVVESVCEELLRLYSCVATFSQGGAIQAVIDVLAFRDSVNKFLTPTSTSLLEQALQLIPAHDQLQRSKDIRQFLEQYNSLSSLQLEPLRT